MSTTSWGCLQHHKHKQTKEDKNRARASRGKEKKHLPWVSSRAVGEKKVRKTWREKKRGKS